MGRWSRFTDRKLNIVALAVTATGIAVASVIGVVQLSQDDTPEQIGNAVAESLDRSQAGPAPEDSAPLSEVEQAAADLGCGSLDDSLVIEGSLGVANVTAGDTEWSPTVNADPGDEVKFQIYLRNRELDFDIENLRARLVPSGNPYEHLVQLQACGSNTRLLQWSAVVRSPDEAVDLVFRPGSVNIRNIHGDEAIDRGGSDDLVSALGESLGRLPATIDDGENIVTVVVAADVVDRR